VENRRGRNTLERLIKRGAESEIYEGHFLGLHAIYKQRVKKAYRNPEIDHKINYERTILEAKMIYSALKNDINVPAVLFIDPNKYLLVLEYIEGITIRDLLSDNIKIDINELNRIGLEIGKIAGRLHKAGIAHGDFTTNNLIKKDEKIFLIDFGLARRSNDEEDFATDVHVFLRSLESVHSDYKDVIYQSFVKGYSEIVGERVNEIIKLVKEIRMRGRYVEERRKSRASNE